jgi:hypothetical protein
VTSALTERNYAIVDELVRIARELNTTAAAVPSPGADAAWCDVDDRGARRLDQLIRICRRST